MFKLLLTYLDNKSDLFEFSDYVEFSCVYWAAMSSRKVKFVEVQ